MSTMEQFIDLDRSILLHPWFYRKNRSAIARKIDSLLSLSLKPTLNSDWKSWNIFYPWLVRPIHDVLKKYFEIEDLNLVSREEQIDIYIVLSHMMKRSINWLRQFDDVSNKPLLSNKDNLNDKQFLSGIGWFLPIHDAIHGVCRYIKDPENTANDSKRFVPAPFRIRYTWLNDTREMIEEEILAWIWLPKQMKQNIVGYANLLDNGGTMTFWEYCISVEYPKNPEKKQPNYTDLLDEIKKNPHPKLIEMYTYFWENRDNPRVLLDLFLRETQLLVEQLKRRKQHKKI